MHDCVPGSLKFITLRKSCIEPQATLNPTPQFPHHNLTSFKLSSLQEREWQIPFI